MNRFQIDIYSTERDEDYKVISERCNYSALYETSETVEEVLDSLHSGEGISIELIKPTNELPLIRFNYLFGTTPDSMVANLNSRYSLIEIGNKSELETTNETNDIIAIGEVDSLPDDVALEFEEFIRIEFESDFKGLTKTISIYEWGASGYFIDFIVNLSAGFGQKAIEKIYKFLKGKGVEHVIVKQFNTSELKKMIETNFEINTANLKLISSRTHNGETRFVFSSRFIEYILTVDEEGNLIESRRHDLNQTGI